MLECVEGWVKKEAGWWEGEKGEKEGVGRKWDGKKERRRKEKGERGPFLQENTTKTKTKKQQEKKTLG